MRILHAIQSTNPAGGGPIEGIRQLALATEGQHDHRIVSLDHPEAAHLADSPIQIHALGPAGFLGYSPRLVPWLQQHAREYQAVVVHGLWRYVSVGSWRALHDLDVPYFAFPHGMLDPWFNERYPLKHLKKSIFWPWTEYRLLRDARATIFTCETEKLRASRSFTPYRCNPEIVSLGIQRPPNDPDRQTAAFYSQFPKLQGKRVLLFLSRIHPKKGCDLLVQAFAEIAARRSDIHLVIAGPDQEGLTAQFSRVAENAGIADRITWTGMITGDVKWGAYRAAEAFILPTHHENFGIVVVEAMACGLPVLISDQVQIWQEIAASNAGYVEPDTLDGTRRLIERWLAASPTEWDAMRKGALDGFESKFEVNAFAQCFTETIKRYIPGVPQTC